MNLCISTQHDARKLFYYLKNTFHLRADCLVIIIEGRDLPWTPYEYSCSMTALTGRLQTGKGRNQAITKMAVRMEDSTFCYKDTFLYSSGLSDIVYGCHVGISEVTSADALHLEETTVHTVNLLHTFMNYIFPRHFSRPANSSITVGVGNSWVFGSYQCNLLVFKSSNSFQLANRNADISHCTDLLLFVTKLRLIVHRSRCEVPCFMIYMYTTVPLREKKITTTSKASGHNLFTGHFTWKNYIQVYRICSSNFERADLIFYSIFDTRRFYIRSLNNYRTDQSQCKLPVNIDQLVNIYEVLPITIDEKPTNDYNMPEKIYYILWKNTTVSWNQAEAMCESIGGHLSSLSSKTEADFIERLVLGLGFNASLPLYHSPLRYFPFTGIYLGFNTTKVCNCHISLLLILL